MTREELDFIGSMNMCDEISNEAYKKIVCHCREQEPCEDAISRQTTITAIKDYFHDEYYQRTSIQTCRDDFIEDVLTKLSPVTPQPKTGHWIDTDEWRETVDGFEQWGYFRKCSECGYVFKFLEIDNYCPNCGFRMFEPQESEG